MNLFRRTLALLMSFSLLFASFGQAQAAMISNSQLINQAQQSNEKTTLLQTIRRADVQSQLLSMGVNTADIEKRVDQMTQAEVAQLNQQIDQLPAGSGVLGIVVLIFIVFVITAVIGATDIFPFIHPVR
jgi:uncharacterized phage infection (PIP) family protein YhgE